MNSGKSVLDTHIFLSKSSCRVLEFFVSLEWGFAPRYNDESLLRCFQQKIRYLSSLWGLCVLTKVYKRYADTYEDKS